jgi:NAD(P)-dependent dehydrogenase (short-subunit alcohol dehydrogenase family)
VTRVWFVTGASRGLGLEIARAALARGERVVATARDPRAIATRLADLEPDERLLTLALDVTDEQQVEEAARCAEQTMGRVDVLVNNAARGFAGAVEEGLTAEVTEIFAVNLVGLLSVTRAILPGMRRARSGTIVNISSMTGIRAVGGWGLYGASKFAVEGISEAMRDELAPLGVNVTLIEPGPLSTGFLDKSSLVARARTIGDYDAVIRTEAEEPVFERPDLAAAAIVDVVAGGDPPMRVPLGRASAARLEAKLAWMQSDLNRWGRTGGTSAVTVAGPERAYTGR